MNTLLILDAFILTGNGADCVILTVDVPEGVWPFDNKAHVKLEVAAGHGTEYCAKYFPDTPRKVVKAFG